MIEPSIDVAVIQSQVKLSQIKSNDKILFFLIIFKHLAITWFSKIMARIEIEGITRPRSIKKRLSFFARWNQQFETILT